MSCRYKLSIFVVLVVFALPLVVKAEISELQTAVAEFEEVKEIPDA